ncbi:MAG TPA: glycosyltransferase family 39 protein [Solirubrobacteraceae bacterium]|nr:glycosyltransferase family 39 protein [Solirubrobacteraceae bacterium]
MATAEDRGSARLGVAAGAPAGAPAEGPPRSGPARRGDASHARLWIWAGLALVLALALGLRLWGIRQGLPYSYNADEDAHFVPRAIGIFQLGWNPHYFENPPAYTYLLHLVFAVWLGGERGVVHAFATNPTAVFTTARVTAALLGTAAVWLLYMAGARLFDRGVALLAAALQAVAFLPVFYAHLAVNDVPTLAPLTLSLLGTALVLRSGRLRWYLLAGAGLGLGCAAKYTAGIVLLPLLAAAAANYIADPRQGPRVLLGLLLAGACALACFVAANPYSVLDFHAFAQGIQHQSSVSAESEGKLGAPHESGIFYYLWSFTWGLGWVPALAALGGAVTVWRRERRLGWVLVPAPLLYLAFMGAEDRYFGRWLLPIFPIVSLLAALFALQCAAFAARRGPRPLALGLGAFATLALCGQGLLYSIHSDRVLARADTRNLTRAWLVAHVPAGTPVVVDPSVPAEWAQDVGHPTMSTREGHRWPSWPALESFIEPDGRLRTYQLHPLRSHPVTIEDYERTLSPALIGDYERNGYCWVVSGYAEAGRAYADPAAVPQAIAYYRALQRQAQVVYRVSPYRPGAHPVAFNFDWTFDYYPLAYQRPGPEMTVYRLRGGRCARG